MVGNNFKSQSPVIFGDQPSGNSNLINDMGLGGSTGFNAGPGTGLESIFGNNTLQMLGGGADIFKNLFGMYNQFQGMEAAKTGMNNQTTAFNNNAQNQQAFNNATIDVFGSGQQKMNNQMGQMV